MKAYTAFCLGLALVISAAPAALAADGSSGDDGFGNTYFTAQTPSALGGDAGSTSFAEQQNGSVDAETDFAADMDAAALSNIEPAAGGDNVFTLPDDPEDAAAFPAGTSDAMGADTGHLNAPTAPVIPGMTVPQTASPSQ